MIGICIKAGITCPSCETKIPLNALVPSIRCPGCGDDLKLTLDNWKSVLENAIKNAPSYSEGEGSSMTVMGSYNYKIVYGKLSPRYDDTKESIDMDTLLGAIDQGVILHPETKAPTSIRRIPQEYAEEFKGVIALVGEDTSLLPGSEAGQNITEGTSGPVAFQCPGCAGNLIIDGKERTVVCSFCDTQVYLPDDLWFALHPVQKKKRWFLLFNEMVRPVEWEREVYDAAQDSEGNFYFALEADFQKPTLLLSTKPDRLLRWKRDDLNIVPRTTRGHPKMAVTQDGRLLVTCSDRAKLFIISPEDGSTIEVIDEPEEEPSYRYFSMKDTFDFSVFPDNTLLLYRICHRKDDRGYFYDLQRFDLEGNLLELWDRTAEKLSFFDKVRKFFSSKTIPYSITETKGYPVGARDTDIRLSIGSDGCVYMLSFVNLLKLAPSGRKLYSIKLPCNYTTGRAAVNDLGEAFVVGHREDDRIEILRVSPDGTSTTVAVKSRTDGGPLEKDGLLTLSPGGGFNLIGYGGYWMDFNEGPKSSPELSPTAND
jgi:hypothetical protein